MLSVNIAVFSVVVILHFIICGIAAVNEKRQSCIFKKKFFTAMVINTLYLINKI